MKDEKRTVTKVSVPRRRFTVQWWRTIHMKFCLWHPNMDWRTTLLERSMRIQVFLDVRRGNYSQLEISRLSKRDMQLKNDANQQRWGSKTGMVQSKKDGAWSSSHNSWNRASPGRKWKRTYVPESGIVHKNRQLSPNYDAALSLNRNWVAAPESLRSSPTPAAAVRGAVL